MVSEVVVSVYPGVLEGAAGEVSKVIVNASNRQGGQVG